MAIDTVGLALRAQRADLSVEVTKRLRKRHRFRLRDDQEKAIEAATDRIVEQLIASYRQTRRTTNGRRPSAALWLDYLEKQRESRDQPGADRLRAHAAKLARDHGVELSDWETCRGGGYALVQLRIAVGPPIRSEFSYATRVHEIAHCVNKCLPSHRPTVGLTGHRLCVACEIRAWSWFIDRALVWTPLCHENLTQGLRSYRWYATAEEQHTIDFMCSPTGFRAAHVRRIELGLE